MLLERIIALQEKRGLSDAAFSRSLKINQGNWSRIKAGERPVDSPGFLKTLLMTYPELIPDVLQHFSREGRR